MIKKYNAFARFIPYSPYKLRPIVDLVRNKRLDYALRLIESHRNKRTIPVKKVVLSAFANAKNLFEGNCESNNVTICDIRVDQGPIRKYYKPSAKGRAAPQKRRFCHISVVLKVIGGNVKDGNGTEG
jgi:large subunit ribosomal protein L22